MATPRLDRTSPVGAPQQAPDHRSWRTPQKSVGRVLAIAAGVIFGIALLTAAAMKLWDRVAGLPTSRLTTSDTPAGDQLTSRHP